MHKRAVEHMLDAELDAHLDNEKHEKTTTKLSTVTDTEPKNKILF
ncbi:hypothetical protein MASR1M29_12140 [Cloacibacterium normanense]